MRLRTKIIIAAVAATAVTGSFAWVNTVVDVGTAVVDTVGGAALSSVKSYIEENYTNEEGDIEIPEEDIEALIGTVKSYATVENIQSMCDSAGISIDVQAVSEGDFSSISEWMDENGISISKESFEELFQSLQNAE